MSDPRVGAPAAGLIPKALDHLESAHQHATSIGGGVGQNDAIKTGLKAQIGALKDKATGDDAYNRDDQGRFASK